MSLTKVQIYGGEVELTDVNVHLVPVGGGGLVTIELRSEHKESENGPDVVFARTEFFPYQEGIATGEAIGALVADVLTLFKGLVEAQGGKLELPEVGD